MLELLFSGFPFPLCDGGWNQSIVAEGSHGEQQNPSPSARDCDDATPLLLIPSSFASPPVIQDSLLRLNSGPCRCQFHLRAGTPPRSILTAAMTTSGFNSDGHGGYDRDSPSPHSLLHSHSVWLGLTNPPIVPRNTVSFRKLTQSYYSFNSFLDLFNCCIV